MIMVSEVTDEEKERAEEQIDKNATVKKSNAVISSRYKASLLENQLTSICLSRVKNQNGEYIASITSGEIKRLFGMKESNSKIYKRLYTAAQNMSGRTIAAEDGKGNFDVVSVITGAHYRDGVFSVEFNPNMKSYLFELKDKYTSYTLANVLNFKSDYSFRIYEICKMDAWMLNDGFPVNVIEYGLSELRCIIGDVDTQSPKLQAMMKEKKPDWDRIVELAPEKSHTRWDNFRRQVLDVAKREINSQCDICIDYQPIKSGKGSKVVGVKFFVKKNKTLKEDPVKVKDKMKEVDQLNRQYDQKLYTPSPELLKYIGHNKLKKSDLMIFLRDGNGDNDLVIKAIEKADEQPNLKNYVGWIRTCVRNRCYDEPTRTISGSAAIGDKVNEAEKDISSDEDKYLIRYWEKAKKEQTDIFLKFSDFLGEHKINGRKLNVAVFESIHSKADCGDLFMRWVTGEDIDII